MDGNKERKGKNGCPYGEVGERSEKAKPLVDTLCCLKLFVLGVTIHRE
jgi:hypothetical protein